VTGDAVTGEDAKPAHDGNPTVQDFNASPRPIPTPREAETDDCGADVGIGLATEPSDYLGGGGPETDKSYDEEEPSQDDGAHVHQTCALVSRFRAARATRPRGGRASGTTAGVSVLEIRPLEEGAKSGAEAIRAGRRVGRLVGEERDSVPGRGPHVWVGLDDHELAEDESAELYADLYSVAGDPWVRAGRLAHFVLAPADDAHLRVWFSLGFGQEQVHAERATYAEAPPQREGLSVRRATVADLELLLDLGRTIAEHQIGPPVWSGLPVPNREAHREGWAEFISDDFVYAVTLGDEPVGYAGLYEAEPGVIELSVAGTVAAARGRGAGLALVEHALNDAHENGFRNCRLDFRSTNLLASRFWLGRGFHPTHYRLRRDVQPYADAAQPES
jgi:ribosomal protein S18 acetylase RimI-like enzyme